MLLTLSHHYPTSSLPYHILTLPYPYPTSSLPYLILTLPYPYSTSSLPYLISTSSLPRLYPMNHITSSNYAFIAKKSKIFDSIQFLSESLFVRLVFSKTCPRFYGYYVFSLQCQGSDCGAKLSRRSPSWV